MVQTMAIGWWVPCLFQERHLAKSNVCVMNAKKHETSKERATCGHHLPKRKKEIKTLS